MMTQQLPVDFPESQAALYGVALSLDAFLINGILYGVLQREMFPTFLETTAGNLMRDLARLEGQTTNAPISGQLRVEELLASLRVKCQQLVDLVSGLRAFRTLALDEVRSTVSLIAPLREDCVHLIEQLEARWGASRPFYQSRPAHSTAAVNDFLTDLEGTFAREWAAGNAHSQETSHQAS